MPLPLFIVPTRVILACIFDRVFHLSRGPAAAQDLMAEYRSVCDFLARLDSKMMIETELKLALGFRFRQGHRAWRRCRSVLTKAGYIEIFMGRSKAEEAGESGAAEGASVSLSFVRLLREWDGQLTPASAQQEEADVGEDAEAEAEQEPGPPIMVRVRPMPEPTPA